MNKKIINILIITILMMIIIALLPKSCSKPPSENVIYKELEELKEQIAASNKIISEQEKEKNLLYEKIDSISTEKQKTRIIYIEKIREVELMSAANIAEELSKRTMSCDSASVDITIINGDTAGLFNDKAMKCIQKALLKGDMYEANYYQEADENKSLRGIIKADSIIIKEKNTIIDRQNETIDNLTLAWEKELKKNKWLPVVRSVAIASVIINIVLIIK